MEIEVCTDSKLSTEIVHLVDEERGTIRGRKESNKVLFVAFSVTWHCKEIVPVLQIY